MLEVDIEVSRNKVDIEELKDEIEVELDLNGILFKGVVGGEG